MTFGLINYSLQGKITDLDFIAFIFSSLCFVVSEDSGEQEIRN